MPDERKCKPSCTLAANQAGWVVAAGWGTNHATYLPALLASGVAGALLPAGAALVGPLDAPARPHQARGIQAHRAVAAHPVVLQTYRWSAQGGNQPGDADLAPRVQA